MMPTSIVRCGLVTRQENEATGFPPKRLLWLFVNMAESEEGESPNTSTTSTTISSTPKASPRVNLRHDDNAVLTNF